MIWFYLMAALLLLICLAVAFLGAELIVYAINKAVEWITNMY